MSNQYPGGFITKSPVAPTTNAASGIWTIDQAMQYIKAGTWPGLPDPYFPYVTMLLPGNGTNGAQNNTFLDSSTNNFTITRNGNTTQGTFAPYGANWSNYFGGSGDYINFASSSALSFASDFTVEAWVYNNYGTGTFNPAVLYDSSSNAISSFEINNGTNYPSVAGITATNTVTRYTFSTGPSVPVLQWVHVAWVRSSGTVKVYVNGTASTSTLSNSAATGQIVQVANGRTSGSPWNGYISNLRITSSAVYTSNFTPSTVPLTAISGTQLLTCQSNRFRDNSSNALSFTTTGSPTVQVFSPFSPTASYDASTIGGSGYFDGSGDYLAVASGYLTSIGTGNFTVEGWWNFSDFTIRTTYFQRLWSFGTGLTNDVTLNVDTTGNLIFRINDIPIVTQAANAMALNTWNHVAVVRSSGTVTVYLNGVSVGSAANSTNLSTQATSPFYVGSEAGGGGGYFIGYCTNLRVTNTAVYTGSFTPSTTPLTAIAGTSLLLSYTNAGVIDNAMMNDLETVGNAQISTTQSKWGGSSIAFDGTGDRLTIPFTNDFLELGINGQNFTVEAWIYPTNTMASVGQILSKGGGAASWSTTNGAQYQWGISSSALSWQFNSSGSAATVNSGTVTLNAWQHIAISYDGTTTRTFLNGVLQATSTSSYTAPATRNLQYIGMTQSGGYTQEYYGYIDDFRITKGYARYTANFTAPTGPFPTR